MCYNGDMEKEIIVVSGISGAGKTTVSNILEDLGYLCIDQLPSPILKNFVELVENDASFRYDKVVMTITIFDLDNYFTILDNLSIKARAIMLDADEEVILNRYKFTRRLHPLLLTNKVNTLEEAVAMEKEILARYAEKFEVINTSNISEQVLKKRLATFLDVDESYRFTISFVSFGYKNGLPQDADIIIDTRFLDNPYYTEELRHMTGNDSAVYDFVFEKDVTKEFISHITPYLDFVFTTYISQSKRHLTVAIGCTGGQHRSVSIANWLYRHYRDRYVCLLAHRELHEH